MIAPPKQRNAHLASAWVGGITLVMLIVGGQGALRPLLPAAPVLAEKPDIGELVALEEFDAPAAAAEDTPAEPQPVEVQDLEIPPLPVIEQPVQPPEMVEITPLENPPSVTPTNAPTPRPQPAANRPPASASTGTGVGGAGSGAVTTFTGGGTGRSPSPSYPASARSAGQQGTVRLLVTVETSGIPSSVEVQTSSGFSALDNAARDHVSRRWRWPAGDLRRYLVPIRFRLQ